MDPLDRLARQQKLKKGAVVTGQVLIVLAVLVLLALGINSVLGLIFDHNLGWVKA